MATMVVKRKAVKRKAALEPYPELPQPGPAVLAQYTNPPHPTAFSGITNVAAHHQILPDKASEILAYTDVYGLHREYKKPRVRNPIYIRFKREQVQVDLIDMQALSGFNNGYKYLVCAIDCFTKFLWVRPVRSKEAVEVLRSMQSMIAEMVEKPRQIFCDRGTELKNHLMIAYLQQEGIKLIHPSSELKAAIVERVNRSLQNLLYKYMTHNETRSYVVSLPLIVHVYNTRPHRSIDHLTPTEAEQPENAERVLGALQRHYQGIERPKLKIKFKVGDVVRYKTNSGNRFARGYEEQFSRELCKIDSVNKKMAIPMYKLRSMDTGDLIVGGFYNEELQARPSDEFKVETVLQRQVRGGIPYCLVKWVGFGDAHNSWIPESNVTRVFG